MARMGMSPMVWNLSFHNRQGIEGIPTDGCFNKKKDSKPLDNLDNQKLKMYPGTYRSLNMMAPAICCPYVFDYI